MLKVFWLVILTVFCASSVEAVVISAAAIEAASAAISAGTSLAGTSINQLMNINYAVVCGIEVENWTKFTLLSPSVQIEAGALQVPPHTILPGKIEAMIARKTSYSPKGSYGTVSWRINSTQYDARRVVVMWSVPLHYAFYSNVLGLGLTKPGNINHPSGNSWFKQMYNGKATNGLDFKRKTFHYDVTEILFEDNEFKITGIMGSGPHAKVKIEVRPQSYDDLASSIKALIKKRKVFYRGLFNSRQR